MDDGKIIGCGNILNDMSNTFNAKFREIEPFPEGVIEIANHNNYTVIRLTDGRVLRSVDIYYDKLKSSKYMHNIFKEIKCIKKMM